MYIYLSECCGDVLCVTMQNYEDDTYVLWLGLGGFWWGECRCRWNFQLPTFLKLSWVTMCMGMCGIHEQVIDDANFSL